MESMKLFSLTLPNELLSRIFFFLDAKDICRCRQVCKSWADVSFENSLWKTKYEQLLCLRENYANNFNSDWEAAYRVLFTRELNWSLGKFQTRLMTHRVHAPISSICLKRNYLAIVSLDNILRVWRFHAGSNTKYDQLHEENFVDQLDFIELCPQHNLIIVAHSFTGTIRLFNLVTFTHVQTIQLQDSISYVTTSGENDENGDLLAIGTRSGLIEIWDIKHFVKIYDYNLIQFCIISLHLIASTVIALSSYGSFFLLNLTTSLTYRTSMPTLFGTSIPALFTAHDIHFFTVSENTLLHYNPIIADAPSIPFDPETKQLVPTRELSVPGKIVGLAAGGFHTRCVLMAEKDRSDTTYALYLYDCRTGTTKLVRGLQNEFGWAKNQAFSCAIDDERVVIARSSGEIVVIGFRAIQKPRDE